MDFVVPLHPEDLEAAKPGRVYVKAVVDVEGCADIDAVLDGACRRERRVSPAMRRRPSTPY